MALPILKFAKQLDILRTVYYSSEMVTNSFLVTTCNHHRDNVYREAHFYRTFPPSIFRRWSYRKSQPSQRFLILEVCSGKIWTLVNLSDLNHGINNWRKVFEQQSSVWDPVRIMRIRLIVQAGFGYVKLSHEQLFPWFSVVVE